MKYTKSIWPNWDSTSTDATINLYDDVYIPYDDLFIADGFINKLLPETNEVEVTLSYLYNFSDNSRSMRDRDLARSHCLEFPRDTTRIVNASEVTFLSRECD